MKMRKVVFIDPMSYNNLAVYDNSLISHMTRTQLYFFGNKKIENDTNVYKVIYSYSNKHGFFKLFSYLFSQFILLFNILLIRPQLVHFQWLKIPVIDKITLKFIKLLKIKIILTLHNVVPHNANDSLKKRYLRLYNDIDHFIIHDENSAEEFCSISGRSYNNVSIIPHGTLDLNTNKSDFERRLAKGKILVGFLGNMSRYKGTEILSRVLIENAEKWENLHFILAGSGEIPSLPVLQNITNISVKNQFLSSEEYFTIFKQCDLLLLPYLQISQSGVLLSAIQEEIPVIVTNTGGLVEPFKYADIGWIIDSSHIYSQLIKVLSAINNDPILVSEKKDADWSALRTFYSWDTIALKSEILYERLINE